MKQIVALMTIQLMVHSTILECKNCQGNKKPHWSRITRLLTLRLSSKGLGEHSRKYCSSFLASYACDSCYKTELRHIKLFMVCYEIYSEIILRLVASQMTRITQDGRIVKKHDLFIERTFNGALESIINVLIPKLEKFSLSENKLHSNTLISFSRLPLPYINIIFLN